MDGGLVYFIRNVIFTREAIGRAGVCVCRHPAQVWVACAAMRRYVDVAVIRNCLLSRGKYKGFFGNLQKN